MHNPIIKHVTLILVVLSLLGIFIVVSEHKKRSEDAYAQTYSACMEARGTISGELEELCGEWLTYTNSEFKCNDFGCWVNRR